MCFAAQASVAHGARFGPSETTRGFEVEERVLEASELRRERLDDSARLARSRWRMIALGSSSGGGDPSSGLRAADADNGEDAHRNPWTRGEEYVRLLKEGVILLL
jgi:hypothetical protein